MTCERSRTDGFSFVLPSKMVFVFKPPCVTQCASVSSVRNNKAKRAALTSASAFLPPHSHSPLWVTPSLPFSPLANMLSANIIMSRGGSPPSMRWGMRKGRGRGDVSNGPKEPFVTTPLHIDGSRYGGLGLQKGRGGGMTWVLK